MPKNTLEVSLGSMQKFTKKIEVTTDYKKNKETTKWGKLESLPS